MNRIGMIGPFDPKLADGVSKSMFSLLIYLTKLGHEAFIVSFVHDTTLCRDRLLYLINQKDTKIISKGDSYCNVIHKGINLYYEILPCNRGEALSASPKALKRVLRKSKEYKTDYIFTNDVDFTGLLAKYLIGASGAHFFHSNYYVKNYIHQPILKKILLGITVFAASKFLKDEVKRLLDVNAVIWPPFINLDDCSVIKKEGKLKSIGFYSAGKHKGDKLVSALIKQMPHINFFVVGRNFSYRPKTPLKNLKYLGDIRDIKKFYQKISLLLVPSIIREGYSRIILEAAASGIPAIANKIGGTPEALGKSGILVAIEPSEAKMINKYMLYINRLFGNAKEYEKYSKKALERASEYKEELNRMSEHNYTQYIKPLIS